MSTTAAPATDAAPPAAKSLGVTPIISAALPEPYHLELNTQLEALLAANACYETAEEVATKKQVVETVNQLALEFIRNVTLSQPGKTEEDAVAAGGKIFVFGSYRLGTNSKGGDVDTLVIAPRNVTREDFFNVMGRLLTEKGSAVQKLKKVEAATVPLMNLEYNGVELDILFARLSLPNIPADLKVSSDDILRNLDEASVLSLNGVRVNEMILELVPNLETFRVAVRFIKLWAKNRGIYSNKLGYPGGVAWVILTARVCQLYPNAAPSYIVMRFFTLYRRWKWPNPVILAPISKNPPGLSLPIWNPLIKPDSDHVLPVITPAYPCLNTTANCPVSNAEIIKAEFARGDDICKEILEQKQRDFDTLVAPSDFFTRYKNYLMVLSFCNLPDEAERWLGYVESKIIKLVNTIQKVEGVRSTPVFCRGFQNADHQTPHLTQCFFIAIVPHEDTPTGTSAPANPAAKVIEIGAPVDEWRRKISEVYHLNNHRTLKPADFQLSFHVEFSTFKQKNLPAWVGVTHERKKRKRTKTTEDKKEDAAE